LDGGIRRRFDSGDQEKQVADLVHDNRLAAASTRRKMLRRHILSEEQEPMPTVIPSPTRIEACGTPPKIIEEFVGRVNSQTAAVSIARMVSPSGWSEPGQTPEFDEYTIVLRGQLQVETKEKIETISAGQAAICPCGQWVRYSTPGPEGAEYIAVCLPAFSPEAVHRDIS
jgi:mannose-6-phosphate isomerase-like protein (cupin superfamily)